MKKRILTIAIVVVIAAVSSGCATAAKAPAVRDGKQVGIFVLLDPGIKAGMKEDERKDRNEMGQFAEENLVEQLKHEGYNATPIQSRNQYIQGSSNYLVMVRIIDLRLVGHWARGIAGFMAGSTELKSHYDVYGSDDKMLLSYDDEENSVRKDWTAIPEELNERLVIKIKEKLNVIGNTKEPTSERPSHVNTNISPVPAKNTSNNATHDDTGTRNPSSRDDSARLQKLKDMRDRGVITQEEYNKKRQEILDAM